MVEYEEESARKG